MILFKKSKMREAIRAGNYVDAYALLNAGLSPNVEKPENSFLCQAIRSRQPEILNLLIEHGGNVNIDCGWGENLLHIAARENQIECAAAVLRHAPQLAFAADSHKRTPLHYATVFETIDLVRFLLENGAIPQEMDLDAAIKTKNPDIALLLVESMTMLHTPLHRLQWVLEKGYPDFVANAALQKIVQAGPSNFLLHAAIKDGGGEKVVNFLLDNVYYDINLPALETGATPLHLAAEHGPLQIVARLLKRGADTKARDANGNTPLDLARKNAREDIASRLSLYEPVKTEKWRPLQDDRIARILRDDTLGYRLTEIFNFAQRERTQIYQNLETKAEAMETRDFDEIAEKEPLREALRQLSATGVETAHLSIHGITKNKLPLQGR